MDFDLFDVAGLPSTESARWRVRLAHLHPGRWLQTLKFRVAAVALCALFGGMALIAWNMGREAERHTVERARLTEQVDSERTAAIMERRVAQLQRALLLVGEQLDAATLHEPRRLQAFLENRPIFRAMFAVITVAAPMARRYCQ